MPAKWNGSDLQTRLSEELWDTSTAFKARVLDWINDGLTDICDRMNWVYLRRTGQKVLTASAEEQDLNLGKPTAPTVALIAGGALTVGTEYRVKVTFCESSSGRESIAGVASAAITPTSGNQAIALTNIPISPDPLVDQRKIYVKVGSADYFWSSTIEDNTATAASVSLVTIQYDTASNFTYDSTLIEQSGSAFQIIDFTPADEEWYARLDTSIDADRTDGTKTGTATGGAAISGGKLDLTGGTVKHVTWDDNGYTPASANIGTVRIKVTPNYTGNPATSQFFFYMADAGGPSLNNRLLVFHSTGGDLQCVAADSAGNTKGLTSAAWSPVAGTEYEIEYSWDLTNGSTHVHVDGVQLGSTVTDTGTRSTASLTIISSGHDGTASPTTASNFSIRDVQMFDVKQHASGSDFSSEVPRSVSAIAHSSDTDLTVEYNTATSVRGIQDLTETSTLPSGTAIRWIAKIDNDYWYWSGSAWVASSQTFATANTVADFNTNAGSMPLSNGEQNFYPVAVLNTTDGVNSPILTTLAFDYFAAGIPEENPTSTIEPPDIHAIAKLDGAPWITSVGYPLNYVSLRQLKQGNVSSSTGTPSSWGQLTESKLLLNPAPSTALTLSYYYFIQPPRIYANEDSQPILPIQFRRALEAYVVMRGYQYRDRDGKEEKEGNYEMNVEQAIARFNKRAKRIGTVRDTMGDTFGFEVN